MPSWPMNTKYTLPPRSETAVCHELHFSFPYIQVFLQLWDIMTNCRKQRLNIFSYHQHSACKSVFGLYYIRMFPFKNCCLSCRLNFYTKLFKELWFRIWTEFWTVSGKTPRYTSAILHYTFMLNDGLSIDDYNSKYWLTLKNIKDTPCHVIWNI